MFRITRNDRPEATFLKVEGRIVGDDSALLERECRSLLAGGFPLRLDLSEVRFVDLAGVAMLRALRRDGLGIDGWTPLVREVLDADGP